MKTTENLLINGKRPPSESGKTAQITNPFNGELLAEVAEGSADDIDLAVRSASAAFQGGSWASMNSRDRTKLLLKIAAKIRESAEELARLESSNVGKPIRESRGEAGLAADCFEYYAGAINKVGGDTKPVAAPGLGLTLREPVGVCGLILPWNFPLAITAWKVAPALAMGNTVVVKPAELTPLTALRLGEIALEAGLPEGVFNIVPGAGPDAGEALVKHPMVHKISFTGSTQVGAHITHLAADSFKRLTLELGGKSANIVFADADLEKAAASAVWSVLGNAGQDCCARSRLLVQKDVFVEFSKRIENLFARVVLGDPLSEDTEIGPLISPQHRERVCDYIRLGKKEGAELLAGGTIPEDAPFKKGNFLKPALFSNVTNKMRIAREEIFGPVLCAIPFTTEEEAIAIANDSDYGLSGSIWTKEVERAIRMARAVRAGVLSVNSGNSVHLELPFGGFKQSGFGRELGLAALDHYSEIKSVYFHTG